MSDNKVHTEACLTGCFMILTVIFIGIAVSAGFGWLTMTVLAALGIHLSFWICWGIWILLSALFGVNTK